MVYPFYLEFFYSKEEVLEAYFNIAPYGFNIEGVGAAATIYFDQSPSQLSLIEALTLSVIPQSPYERTRHVNKSRKVNLKLKEVRNRLFDLWVAHNPKWKSKSNSINMDLDMRPPKGLPFLGTAFNHSFVKKFLQSRHRVDLGLSHSVFSGKDHEVLYSKKKKNRA